MRIGCFDCWNTSPEINAGERKWYYFNEISDDTKGALMTNVWVDNYYVNQEGMWEERTNNAH